MLFLKLAVGGIYCMSKAAVDSFTRCLALGESSGRSCLNRHNSCITNVYKLDAFVVACSLLTCGSMCLGCLVLVD